MSALPDGPPAHALLQTAHWARDPVGFLEGARARYGEVFTQRVAFLPPLIHVTSPELIREIVAAPAEVAHAGEANRIMAPILGQSSLFLLDEQRHARHRKLLHPPFHGPRLEAFRATMQRLTEGAAKTWPLRTTLRLLDALKALSLDIIVATLLGVDAPDAHRVWTRDLARLLDDMTSQPLYMLRPLQRDLGRLTAWRAITQHRARVDENIRALIRARWDAPCGDDVLSLLLAARDEEGAPLREDEVRDELVTLIVAGHDTVASALAFTIEFVAHAPHVLAQIRDESSEGEMPFLDATIRESLRLAPVLPIVSRLLMRPWKLGPYMLPAGVRLTPSIYLAHREPRVWANPTSFEPTRFLDRKMSPWVHLPFGGGARRCIGMGFAMMEMRVVLSHLFRMFTFVPQAAAAQKPERRGVTLAPRGGLPMRLLRSVS